MLNFLRVLHKIIYVCNYFVGIHLNCLGDSKTKPYLLIPQNILTDIERQTRLYKRHACTGVKLDGKSIWKIHIDFFFENPFFLNLF